MILDVLENAHRYLALHNGFATAFEFLMRSDLKELLEGKYEIDGEICVSVVESDFWSYDAVIGYNNYFSFYTRPKYHSRYGSEEEPECFVSRSKTILTTCDFKPLNEDTLTLNYRMKYSSGFQEEDSVGVFEDTIKIPDTLDYNSVFDWLINELYLKSYSKALLSQTFKFRE